MKQPHELDLPRVVGPGPRGNAPPHEDGVMTAVGWFSYAELGQVGARLVNDLDGRPIVHFPVRYDPTGPVYAPLGLDGHAARLAIAKQDAASEERRKRDRERARGVEAPAQRRRRWEDE